ncbi:glucosyl transferase, partial [Shigella flexneri]|nr:glucosyl transferase [Shigella flexneri]
LPRLFVLMPIVAVILFSCLSNFHSIKHLNYMFFYLLYLIAFQYPKIYF